MVGSLLRSVPLVLVNVFLLWLGISETNSARATPDARATLFDLVSIYTVIGLLGMAVLFTFQAQEQRIRQLERELRDRAGPPGPSSGSDSARG